MVSGFGKIRQSPVLAFNPEHLFTILRVDAQRSRDREKPRSTRSRQIPSPRKEAPQP
ncbi:MAG: hypothetical protein AB4290_31220 [Spirulina sp.]